MFDYEKGAPQNSLSLRDRFFHAVVRLIERLGQHLRSHSIGRLAGGFPFAVTEENAELVKAKALSRLMKELQKGDECAESYSEEEALRLLGVEP